VSGPEESSDAELIAALQEADAGLRRVNAQLREVINAQGVHIEALTGADRGAVGAAGRAGGADRRVGTPAGVGLVELLEAALVGSPVPQAGAVLLAHVLGPEAG
jgi:hypothetical protein